MTPVDGATADLRGRAVLVCGATGGIGSALARELVDRGAHVSLVARDRARLEALGLPGLAHAADLRSPAACVEVVEAAVQAHGRLDAVVNAVGVVAFGPVVDTTIDTAEELFLTNTFVPIMLAAAALPRLEPEGVLVNVSGMIAEQNLPGMAVYGASKAAVRAFDEGLAREARRSRIRVLDARPPHTETGLVDRALVGRPPRLPRGLDPARVATVICDAIESGATDLASSAFTAS